MFARLKVIPLLLLMAAAIFGGASDAAAFLSETRVGGYQLFDAALRQVEATQVPESQQANGFSWYDTASECSVAAKTPVRSLSERIKDFKGSPGKWEQISASAEPAKAAKAKGGISIESVFKNKETGETIHVHDVFTESGKELPKHPSFRDYGKGE